MTDTRTAARFTLDEETARALASMVAVDEPDDPDGEPELYLGPRWEPRDVGNEPEIWRLIEIAQDKKAITHETGARVSFVFDNDSDGGQYTWHVQLDASDYESPVLSGYWEEMRRVGDPDTTGADAAFALMQEAVNLGNGILDRFTKWLAAPE